MCQLPVGGEILLDHVGHFVRNAEAARLSGRALLLRRSRCRPIPMELRPNRQCHVRRGSIEVLFKTADTPLGREFDLALAGRAGVHLAAFWVADVEGQHRRLSDAGFAMRPLVQFQRPVETVTGSESRERLSR